MTFDSSGSEKAFKETLDLLEWPRLCENLANFASTAQGHLHCLSLPLPPDLSTSQLKLAETLELAALDGGIDGGISFQGVHDLRPLLNRCAKGGTSTGEEDF